MKLRGVLQLIRPIGAVTNSKLKTDEVLDCTFKVTVGKNTVSLPFSFYSQACRLEGDEVTMDCEQVLRPLALKPVNKKRRTK